MLRVHIHAQYTKYIVYRVKHIIYVYIIPYVCTCAATWYIYTCYVMEEVEGVVVYILHLYLGREDGELRR